MICGFHWGDLSTETSAGSSLSTKHHLLPLALSRHRALLTMLSDVFLLALDSTQLISLDVARLLDRLGHVSVSLDPLDLGHVRVSSD